MIDANIRSTNLLNCERSEMDDIMFPDGGTLGDMSEPCTRVRTSSLHLGMSQEIMRTSTNTFESWARANKWFKQGRGDNRDVVQIPLINAKVIAGKSALCVHFRDFYMHRALQGWRFWSWFASTGSPSSGRIWE
jgi:hypothetical protein